MEEIVVGALIEYDDGFLLVQEGKNRCKGKWNIPSGHLKYNESLLDAVKREVFEETGCVINPTGVVLIGNIVSHHTKFVAVVFTTKLLSSNISFDGHEILDVKKFTYQEILNMKDELRIPKWVIDAINSYRNKNVCDLDMVNIIRDK